MFLFPYSESDTDLLKMIFLQYPAQPSALRDPHTERRTQICKQTQAKPTRGGRQRTAGNVSTVRRGTAPFKAARGEARIQTERSCTSEDARSSADATTPSLPADAHPRRGTMNQWKAAENLVCSSMGMSNACRSLSLEALGRMDV